MMFLNYNMDTKSNAVHRNYLSDHFLHYVNTAKILLQVASIPKQTKLPVYLNINFKTTLPFHIVKQFIALFGHYR